MILIILIQILPITQEVEDSCHHSNQQTQNLITPFQWWNEYKIVYPSQEVIVARLKPFSKFRGGKAIDCKFVPPLQDTHLEFNESLQVVARIGESGLFSNGILPGN